MTSDRFDLEQFESPPIDEESGRRLPLHAFDILKNGDLFESTGSPPPASGQKRAEVYVDQKIILKDHGVAASVGVAVREAIVDQLKGSLQLIARLEAARPIHIDIVPNGHRMAAYGFPKHASAQAAGLFWDSPSWTHARIGFLHRSLETERGLVVHEMAHAIARLAFTKTEQEAMYALMLPVYRSRAAVDEVFAIYSEREFIGAFTEHEGQAPGVYGMARRRWDERHVFTRFVRSLYHPYKPPAGTLPSNTKTWFG